MHIFLDIDGVMIPLKPWQAQELMEDGFPNFTTGAVLALNTLISPETHIVLTTSHRDRYSIDEWQQIFERRGILIRNLSIIAPFTFTKRKVELESWFHSNIPPDHFIIIDDDTTLHGLHDYLKCHLISPYSNIGLTPELVQTYRDSLTKK